MSLHALTPELLTRIHYHIIYPNLHWDGVETHPPEKGHAYLASVSRAFQSVVEPHTFRTIKIHHQDDLISAATILTPARGRYIESLECNIQLDSYGEEDRRRKESEEEQRRNNEVFTDAVRDLFSIVSHFNRDGWHGVRLAVHVWSPSDVDRLPEEEQEALVNRLCFSPLRRYERSLLRYLDAPETLPSCERVSDLRIQEGVRVGLQERYLYRAVCPETAGLLVQKCRASLDEVTFNLMDWPRGDVEERKRRRRAFAGVLDNLPPRISNLSVVYLGVAPRDEDFEPPSLLEEGEEEDVLTVSLRRCYMRSRMRRFDVYGTILGVEFYKPPTKGDKRFYKGGDDDDDEEEEEEDREMEESDDGEEDRDSLYDEFWARDGGNSEDDGRPCSDLEDLVANWPKVTADGRWLYRRPEGEEEHWEEEDYKHRDALASNDPDAVFPADPDPELDDPAFANKHIFRIEADPEVCNPLMMNMARLMRRMPAMSTFEWRDVDQSQWPSCQMEWTTNFEGGGELCFHGFGKYDVDGDMIETDEPPVDQEVLDLFREMLEARKPEGEVTFDFPS